MLTFAEFTKANLARKRQFFKDSPVTDWSVSDCMMAAMGELGEIANALKKVRRAELGMLNKNVGDRQIDSLIDAKAKVAGEIGGFMCYLDQLANMLGLSLEDCIVNEFNHKSSELGLPEQIIDGKFVDTSKVNRLDPYKQLADLTVLGLTMGRWVGKHPTLAAPFGVPRGPDRRKDDDARWVLSPELDRRKAERRKAETLGGGLHDMPDERKTDRRTEQPFIANQRGPFNVGALVRYGDGPTALMRIMEISTSGHGQQYWGRCFHSKGIDSARYANELTRPSKEDIERWNFAHDPKDDSWIVGRWGTEQKIAFPPIGSRWMHTGGVIYTIIAHANDVEDERPKYPRTVVYQGPNGKVWAGILMDWYRRMTLVGEPT